MAKPKTFFICHHCKKPFIADNARNKFLPRNEKYCSIQCALWSRVIVTTEKMCWPWKGCRHVKGYGEFSYKGKTHRAHVIAHILTFEHPMAISFINATILLVVTLSIFMMVLKLIMGRTAL